MGVPEPVAVATVVEISVVAGSVLTVVLELLCVVVVDVGVAVARGVVLVAAVEVVAPGTHWA